MTDLRRLTAFMDVTGALSKLHQDAAEYRTRVERDPRTRAVFERAVRDGDEALRLLREFEARGWNAEPTATDRVGPDVAQILLGLYERESTNGLTTGWGREETDRHWAAADAYLCLAAPAEQVRHLSFRASVELDQGRAHRALRLADRAESIGLPPRTGRVEDFAQGDPRAVRASALRLLYDPETALRVLEPVRRELEEVFAAAGGVPGPADVWELLAEIQKAAEGDDFADVVARAGRIHGLQTASAVYERVLDTRAAALRDVGRLEEAEETYHDLLPYYEAQGLPEIGYLQLAVVAGERGAAAQAERYLDLAAPLFEPGRTGGAGVVASGGGGVPGESGALEEAGVSGEAGASAEGDASGERTGSGDAGGEEAPDGCVSEAGGDPVTSLRANVRLTRGVIYCRLRAEGARTEGRLAAALEWCDRGDVCLAVRPDHAAAVGLYAERARAQRELGDIGAATAACRTAVEELDLLLSVPLGHRFDTLHLRFRLPMLREALTVARRAGDADLAARVTDLVKARSFAARLSLTRLPDTATDSPDTPVPLPASATDLSGTATSLPASATGLLASATPVPAHAPHLPAPDDRRRAFDRLTERISRSEDTGDVAGARTLRAERAALLTRMRAVDSRWQLITEHPGFDARRLTAFLRTVGPRRVALSLYEEDGAVLAVLATPDGLRLESRKLSASTHAALEHHAATVGTEATDFWARSGLTLADLVPEAFADAVAGADTCLLSPHGRLHHLPWTLVRHRARHLVRGTALGIVPNLASIPLLGDAPRGQVRRVALIGVTERTVGGRRVPQFPVLGRAIDMLADGLGPERLHAPPVVGTSATAAVLRRLLRTPTTLQTFSAPSTPSVLYLAAHAGAAPGAPFGGLVQMADADVTTGEVLLGRLPFTEVVLPACSTAYRPSRDSSGGHGALAGIEGLPADALDLAGDEATSLVHAFHEAGAAFVLASPFTVHDTPAVRFSLFWFQHRLSGAGPLEATRRAAVSMLDQGKYRPEHWAGITAYGAR
ncbi:tetratricopeptide (TPR) repeat protein [Streptomyces sp. SAI-126]|uniref:CHAT domain-containing protein n=1 Tax=Streptomyces sp. SAI-126 TaxID=3377732 RepID=UPI003C7CA354